MTKKILIAIAAFAVAIGLMIGAHYLSLRHHLQEKLDHVPTLVAVGLGGATGPAPKAMLDQGGQEYADVPIPSWRPDRPAPAGGDPTVTGSAAQGDQPVKVAN